jgi:hypothetical protein
VRLGSSLDESSACICWKVKLVQKDILRALATAIVIWKFIIKITVSTKKLYLVNPLKPGLNYMYHMVVQSAISCILCLWLLYVSECKQRLLP